MKGPVPSKSETLTELKRELAEHWLNARTLIQCPTGYLNDWLLAVWHDRLQPNANAMGRIEKNVQHNVMSDHGLAAANLLLGRPDQAGSRRQIAFTADTVLATLPEVDLKAATCVTPPCPPSQP